MNWTRREILLPFVTIVLRKKSAHENKTSILQTPSKQFQAVADYILQNKENSE